MIDRRQMLLTGAAFGAGLLAPKQSFAQQTLALGGVELTTVSDGNLTLPGAFIFGPMDKSALPAVLEPYGLTPDSPLTPPCNLTVLRDGERTVLFDAGSGSTFQSTAGKLLPALEAIGLAPEDITHVVFTHGHPDHLWGVLDDFDDPLFADAEHMMGRAEFDYWMAPDTIDTIGEARAVFAVGAKNRLEALEDAITLFDDGEEVLPGVAARLTPGHTPGHMSFEVRNGSQSAMIIGDAIGNEHVAFARPDWPSGSDQDPDLAATTRAALLDSLAHPDMQMIGFHLPHGGLGRVERKDGAYRFVATEA